ncbi:M16 family metallopeptidase [Streptomyces kronopolitis]
MTPEPHAFRLANGLRLLVEPLPGAKLAAVAVTVATGSHSDPPGASGLAHLTEHLMFPRGQGPADSGHVELVEGAGGMCNASTHRDYTSYHSIVPVEMLDSVLAWEARRLADFNPTPSEIRTELGTLAQEIREARAGAATTLPWEAALATLFPGSRDGIGNLTQLRNISPQQARAHFDTHYTADNIVLSVVADATPQAVAATVDGLFGALPPGSPRRAALPSAARPMRPAQPTSSARTGAPLTLLATAMPDPRTELPHYTAQVLLTHILSNSRLPCLVRTTPSLLSAELHCGHHGQWLNSTSPDLLLAVLLLRPDASVNPTRAWQRSLQELANCPPPPDELRRTRNTFLLDHFRHLDSPLGRAAAHGRFAALFPDGPGLAELAALFTRITPDDIAAAARRLLAQEWTPLDLPGATT